MIGLDNMQKQILKFVVKLALIISVVFANYQFAGNASAAMLYTGSAQQVVYQGQSFVIDWFMDTQDKEINTVQLKMKYDPEALEIIDASVGNSTINVWVKPPIFDNKKGEIELIGGVSGGTKTDKLKVFSTTFNPKKTGNTKVVMDESSAVLISDGLGTQAPLTFHQLGFTIYSSDSAPSVVTSSTHPNQTEWYKENTVVFAFTPKPDEQYSYSFSSNLEVFPDENPDEIKAEYVYENLPDGIYYYKLNSKAATGNWVEAAVYRVQIDTTPPEEFKPGVAKDEAIFEGDPFVSFATSDKVSGVSYYEVKFGLLGRWEKINGTYVKLPGLVLGDKIEVRAVDEAGNQQLSSITLDEEHRVPWFKSWLFWFIILFVVCLMYLVYRIYRHFAHKYRI